MLLMAAGHALVLDAVKQATCGAVKNDRELTPLPLLMKVLFGVMFAVATLRTRSLVPAAVAHTLMWAIFANN